MNKFLIAVYVIWKKLNEFRSEHNKYRITDDRLLIVYVF